MQQIIIPKISSEKNLKYIYKKFYINLYKLLILKYDYEFSFPCFQEVNQQIFNQVFLLLNIKNLQFFMKLKIFHPFLLLKNLDFQIYTKSNANFHLIAKFLQMNNPKHPLNI